MGWIGQCDPQVWAGQRDPQGWVGQPDTQRAGRPGPKGLGNQTPNGLGNPTTQGAGQPDPQRLGNKTTKGWAIIRPTWAPLSQILPPAWPSGLHPEHPFRRSWHQLGPQSSSLSST